MEDSNLKIQNEEQKFEFLFMFDVCVFALWPIFKQNPPSRDSENEPAIISILFFYFRFLFKNQGKFCIIYQNKLLNKLLLSNLVRQR